MLLLTHPLCRQLQASTAPALYCLDEGDLDSNIQVSYTGCQCTVDSALVCWFAEHKIHKEELGSIVREKLPKEIDIYTARDSTETNHAIRTALNGYVSKSTFQDHQNYLARLSDLVDTSTLDTDENYRDF